ncbi:transmembrane protein 246-like [Pecten maximus]|uniref:transmembrane protein 246-like n=1 Tax=Pecten maximus TaxID=6579 RepID=UPI0014584DA3|nr:transmembrane protein 246-like [Pecten maximus]
MLVRVNICCCKRLSTGTLFLFTVYLLVILLVVFVCKNIPLSPLFKLFHHDQNKLLERASESNKLRLWTATRYFESKKPADSMKFYDREFEDQMDIVIVVVTVRRKTVKKFSLGYLTQTAAALDRIVRKNKSFDIKLFLCNTETKGLEHKEARFVSLYIPMITKSNGESEKRIIEKNNTYRKETTDYIYCLDHARSMSPRYILMVEDDSIPNENFLEVIKHSLKQLGDRKFAYLKLYYPLKWQGFAFETSRVVELLCFGAIGGSLSLVLHRLCLLKRQWKRSQNVHFTAGFLYIIVVIYLIGRQNIMTFRSWSHHLHLLLPSPACCTPAMLYPVDAVPSLVHFLNSSQHQENEEHIDLQIYNFTMTNNLPGYQVEPNLFRHVGMVSSLSSKIKQPEEFL